MGCNPVSGFSTGKALGYAVLPGIWPRVKGLTFSGFGTLAYFIALTYSMVRLLPNNHPYLNSDNIGKYGIRHVIAAAMHELKFEWKNIDQIIIFFALLAGTTALLMYIAGAIVFFLVSPVMASWFIPPAPETDITFIMLDRIFGIGGIYNSDVTTNLAKWGPFPNNFQVGLQTLFQFYSMALFLVSVLVFAYFIITVVAETSLTGTPFGQRFENIWIPIRMITALGLLMPAFGGFSSAQYAVLYTAKYGAGLATNAWIVYNLNAGDTPVGLINRDTITKPAIPDYSKLIKDLIVIRSCMETDANGIKNTASGTGAFDDFGVAEFMVKGTLAQPLLDFPPTYWPIVPSRSPNVEVLVSGVPFRPQYKNMATFTPALNFYGGGDIRLVFGIHNETLYSDYPGGVFPNCGELVIPVTGQTPEALYVAEGYMAAVVRILYNIPRMTAPAATIDNYESALTYASVKNYYDTSPNWASYARSLFPTFPNLQCSWDSDNDNIAEQPRGTTPLTVLGDCRGPIPSIYWVNLIKRYQEALRWAPLAGYDYLTENVTGEDMNFSIGDTAFTTVGNPNPMWLEFDTIRLGWGGAGVWYNKIAEKNGSLLAAVGAAPYVVRYPYVMEKIKEQRLKGDAKVDQNNCEAYNPNQGGSTSIEMPDGRSQFSSELAKSLYMLCTEVFKNETIRPDDSRAAINPNPILNIINSLFGASGFFNLLDNKNVHPMAMLSTLGRTLIDKAIFNMAAATGTSVIGGLNQMIMGRGDPGFAQVTIGMASIAHAFVSFGTIALVAGVMLYYVLPFMPFMYFFFAVGRWIKTIFEAMVGVPLWALAHLSMKGPGLPGTAAASGYFLILEIGIRPIVTVFALIASFSTFAALVVVLNTIFSLATANIFGTDMVVIKSATDPTTANMRGIFDQFIITMVYVIIVYMIGTSCFKLIDIIPDNIMRWSGAGVRSWGASDNADDLVDQTGRMIAAPAYVMYTKVGSAVTSVGDAAAMDARETLAAMATRQGTGKAPKAPDSPAPSPSPAPGTGTGTGIDKGVKPPDQRPVGQGATPTVNPAAPGNPPPPPAKKPTK